MKILIVGQWNTCRSPMMEALLRRELDRLGDSDVVVGSAGTAEKEPTGASEKAFFAMREKSIDISHHRSRHVSEVPDLFGFDHFYCMEQTQRDYLLAAGINRIHVSIVNHVGLPNPWQSDIAVYRNCAIVLEQTSRKIAENVHRVLMNRFFAAEGAIRS